QQTAYEIPLLLSALGVIMMAGTMNLGQSVNAQTSGWFILPQALGAFIFLVTSVAEMERLPFDLPEAESEIMMGWQAEYPGVLFLAAQGPGFEEEDPRIFCLPTQHDLRPRPGQVEREFCTCS